MKRTNITLPKKFELCNRDVPFYYNDHFITNGCFMIRKSCVKDYLKYCYNDERAQRHDLSKISSTSDLPGAFVIRKTDRLYEDTGTYKRIFVDEVGNEYLFDESYIKHFEIESLFTHGECQIAFDYLGDFFLMPMRNNRTNIEEKVA